MFIVLVTTNFGSTYQSAFKGARKAFGFACRKARINDAVRIECPNGRILTIKM